MSTPGPAGELAAIPSRGILWLLDQEWMRRSHEAKHFRLGPSTGSDVAAGPAPVSTQCSSAPVGTATWVLNKEHLIKRIAWRLQALTDDDQSERSRPPDQELPRDAGLLTTRGTFSISPHLL